MPFIKAFPLQLILITFFSGFPPTLCRICIQCFMLLEMVMKRRRPLLLRRSCLITCGRRRALLGGGQRLPVSGAGRYCRSSCDLGLSHSRSPRPPHAHVRGKHTRYGDFTGSLAFWEPQCVADPGAEGSAVHVGARRAWRSLPCHTLPLRRTPRHIRCLSETRNARLARTGTPAAPAPRPPVWPRRWLDRERLSPE